MKPEIRPESVKVHMLLRLDNGSGHFNVGHASTTEMGDMGMGMYSTLQKAQAQQLVLALRGFKTEVFTLEYPI
jgi:hypothetical protein